VKLKLDDSLQKLREISTLTEEKQPKAVLDLTQKKQVYLHKLLLNSKLQQSNLSFNNPLHNQCILHRIKLSFQTQKLKKLDLSNTHTLVHVSPTKDLLKSRCFDQRKQLL
jgi:hypothetical protein